MSLLLFFIDKNIIIFICERLALPMGQKIGLVWFESGKIGIGRKKTELGGKKRNWAGKLSIYGGGKNGKCGNANIFRQGASCTLKSGLQTVLFLFYKKPPVLSSHFESLQKV